MSEATTDVEIVTLSRLPMFLALWLVDKSKIVSSKWCPIVQEDDKRIKTKNILGWNHNRAEYLLFLSTVLY